MKIIFSLLLLVSNLIASAQDLETLLSIKPHYGDSHFELPRDLELHNIEGRLETQLYWRDHAIFKVEEVDSLPDGNVISIKPVLEGEKNYIRIAITKEGLKNPGAIAELSLYAQAMKDYFNKPLKWFEVVTNARMGSLPALQTLADMRMNVLKVLSPLKEVNLLFNADNFDEEKIKNYIAMERIPQYQIQRDQIQKLAKADAKVRKKKFEARKVIFDELDKSADQLKDLVAKNDRSAVAKLVKAYLPWELMEPVEVKYWKEWLSAVEHPLPMNERVIVLRGLDPGQSFINDAGKAYLLPPVIIRNQGSYNRRLRSLTTMLDKKISETGVSSTTLALDKKDIEDINKSSRISNQMDNHAGDPMGSPHMSFTKAYSTAAEFSTDGKIGIFALDPRLVMPNALSSFPEEVELLASMAVFPDESIEILPETHTPVLIEKRTKKALMTYFGDEEGERIFNREFSTDNPYQGENFRTESKKDFFNWLGDASVENCGYHFSN